MANISISATASSSATTLVQPMIPPEKGSIVRIHNIAQSINPLQKSATVKEVPIPSKIPTSSNSTKEEKHLSPLIHQTLLGTKSHVDVKTRQKPLTNSSSYTREKRYPDGRVYVGNFQDGVFQDKRRSTSTATQRGEFKKGHKNSSIQ